jgi:hypothetical protein
MQLVSCAGCQALQQPLHDLQTENERLRRQRDDATSAAQDWLNADLGIEIHSIR